MKLWIEFEEKHAKNDLENVLETFFRVKSARKNQKKITLLFHFFRGKKVKIDREIYEFCTAFSMKMSYMHQIRWLTFSNYTVSKRKTEFSSSSSTQKIREKKNWKHTFDVKSPLHIESGIQKEWFEFNLSFNFHLHTHNFLSCHHHHV